LRSTARAEADAGIYLRDGIIDVMKDVFTLNSKIIQGTPIVSRDVPEMDVIEAVTLIKNTALLNITGAGMIEAIEVTARVFTAMTMAGVNIIMMSQSSSEANLSVVVDVRQFEKAEATLVAESPGGLVKKITHDKDISVIAVVGPGMTGTPGVSARVFKAMGLANINIMMISQAASEHNISFVVRSKDAERAVQELHEEFGLYGVL
jgi:aspartate kinase